MLLVFFITGIIAMKPPQKPQLKLKCHPGTINPVAVVSPRDPTGQEIPESWRAVSAPCHSWVIQDEGVTTAKVHTSPLDSHINISEHRPLQQAAPWHVRAAPGRMPPSLSAPQLLNPLHPGCLPAPNQPAAAELHPFPSQPTGTTKVCLCLAAKCLGLQCWIPRLRLLTWVHHCSGGTGTGGNVKWWLVNNWSQWCLQEAMHVQATLRALSYVVGKMHQAKIQVPTQDLMCWQLKVMRSVSLSK